MTTMKCYQHIKKDELFNQDKQQEESRTFVISPKADLFLDGALSGEHSAKRFACSTAFRATCTTSFSSEVLLCLKETKLHGLSSHLSEIERFDR